MKTTILVLAEITEWDGNIPNHTYHVIKGRQKIIGYEKASTGEFIKFSQPVTFSRTHRKFRQIRKYDVDFIPTKKIGEATA